MKAGTPARLGKAGAKLWADVTNAYALRVDEARVLEDACRLADVLATLDEEMRDQPVLVKGSTGQPALNPLLVEQRATRAAVARLLAQLKLPDETEPGAGKANPARAAAQSRWTNAHGRTPA